MAISRKLQRKMRSPGFWFELTETRVLDLFAELPNAKRVGKGDEQYVYVPGTRKDRVVLVAHADSVWAGKEDKMCVRRREVRYISLVKDIGIAADDRAGCSLIWRLRNTGHSILIPNKEEGGCKGSKFLMSDSKMAEEINGHQFMIELDRVGNSDLVFYDVGSPEFVKWCEENFIGFRRTSGTSTDIRFLCRDICGVNISTGCISQHNSTETLIVKDWLNTLETVRKVLLKQDLPKFVKPKHQHQDREEWDGEWWARRNGLEGHWQSNSSVKKTIYYTDSIHKCKNCTGIFDHSEINEGCCPICGKAYNGRKVA